MKIGKRLKMLLALSAAFIILIISSLVIRQSILPRHYASTLLINFEDACHKCDSNQIQNLIAIGSPYYELMQGDVQGLCDMMDKFEPGFRIRNIRYFTAGLPWDETTEAEIIVVQLSKTAKISGEERLFSEVDMAKINGEWKIMQYYFPDFIDY